MKITAEPRSDQWNADDFVGGPRTFTIAGVKHGAAEQKYDVELVEGEGRVWRPPLTMLRLLMAVWSDDAKVWAGRRVTLYRDPDVVFGREKVGGIRISHVSHIDRTRTVRLTVSRGQKADFTVEPLVDEAKPVEPTAEQVAACEDEAQLKDWWGISGPERQAQIRARVEEIRAWADTAAAVDERDQVLDVGGA